MKYLSLDIEISDLFELKPGEDLEQHAPFHIAVAATVDSEGGQRLWHSVDAQGAPAASMDQAKARELLDELAARQAAGWMLFTWNGLKFDLRWIGHNAGNLELAARIALAHYDPLFQFFNQRGFPVSLAAVAAGMGLAQKKLMRAEEAPRAWRAGQHQRVMDYVLGDCQMTNQLVERIASEGVLRWVSRQGQVHREPLKRFKTVAEVLAEPEPDQSWRTGRPIRRAQFSGWLPAGLAR